MPSTPSGPTTSSRTTHASSAVAMNSKPPVKPALRVMASRINAAGIPARSPNGSEAGRCADCGRHAGAAGTTPYQGEYVPENDGECRGQGAHEWQVQRQQRRGSYRAFCDIQGKHGNAMLGADLAVDVRGAGILGAD